jgi:hypothetical protein
MTVLYTLLYFGIVSGYSQSSPVRIVTEDSDRRVMVYAVNESETDYDVLVRISGSNFRQSRAQSRYIRVPGASRVFIKALIPIRGKVPTYKFGIELNDSLSNRSIIREYEKIKLQPPHPIIIYYPRVCGGCDSLISSMEHGVYKFDVKYLSEAPETRSQLEQILGSEPLDSLALPIVNVGGKLYRTLENYEQVIEKLE